MKSHARVTAVTAVRLATFVALVLAACEAPVKVEERCGDGFLDPGEACDADNVPVANCEQLGYYSGTGPVTCTEDCQLDLSTCGARCGDSVIQVAYGEECDGAELGGQTCVSAGLGSGTLACTSGCRLDVSGCSEAAVCGDGLVAAPAEECDLSELRGATCQSLGWYGGELGCDGGCRYDLGGCRPFGRCGDGVIQGDYGEACDGFALGGETCTGLGWYGGQLACTDDCTYDQSPCEAAGRCGDGRLQDGAGERCDGDDLGALTCAALFPGYDGGEVACAADCTPDTSGCARCGDGVIQAGAGELCDGTDLAGAECEDLGLYAGTLACAPGCDDFDSSACGGACGDGWVQDGFGEDCEAGLPLDSCCGQEGLGIGALACGAGCGFETAGCAPAVAVGGSAHSRCALLGDGIVRCWGYNDFGQLGDGTSVTRNLPAPVSGLSGVIQLGSGTGDHTCAVLQGGGVRCWGRNHYGQLGNGSTTNSLVPTAVVNLTDVVQVATGDWSTCARRMNGQVACWGYNGQGQLGNDSIVDSSLPVNVLGISAAVHLAVGFDHACVALDDGTANCWGKNLDGQLGDGTLINRRTPVVVLTPSDTPLTGVARVIAGYAFSCTVQTDGDMTCWGRNNYGQLADAGWLDRFTAAPVLLLHNVTAAAAGFAHACAISGGATMCWGYNGDGRLGDGSTTHRNLPTAILGITDVSEVSCGISHTCLRLNTGVLRCAGVNNLGQLGDGTNLDRLTPGFVH